MIFNKLFLDPKEIIDKLLSSVDDEKPLLLTYFNQHCFNIYAENNDYKKALNANFNIYQADLGIFLTLKFLFNKNINRIDATAMNELLLGEIIKKKLPLVLVGGNFDEDFVKSETEKRGIKLAGYINGYFEGTSTEEIIRQIDTCNNQVIMVGMGVPQQELFSEELFENTKSKIIICVGNFFEFYFGTKKRAPIIIQKIGLEWVFRLITEPARLWKRYLFGIPYFIIQVLKLKFIQKET